MKTQLTDEQKNKVIVSLDEDSYAEIFDKVTNNEWTKEMFVFFCRQVHQEGVEAANNYIN
jgi:hypothetical protein